MLVWISICKENHALRAGREITWQEKHIQEEREWQVEDEEEWQVTNQILYR